MTITEHGLYIIDDNFFKDYKSDFWMDNKKENRPNYFLFKDKKGVIWFIPLSTRVNEYSQKIANDEKKHRQCIFYHIGKVNGKNRVFLIGNMFPVSLKYIKRPYTINETPYVVKNIKLINEVHKRASRYLAMVEQGKLKPNVDIIKVRDNLI